MRNHFPYDAIMISTDVQHNISAVDRRIRAAEDAAGRRFEVAGECVNTMASNAGNGVYAVLNLVRWEDGDSVRWGENHDVWSEVDWLAAGRARL